MQNSTRPRSGARHPLGLTLVELLVVLAVISVLASIALPNVKNSLREQRVTRAASLVQSAIQEGRARAIAKGGGGVIIDRIGDENTAERSSSLRIRMADTPPAYSGDAGGAKARYQYVPDGVVSASVSNPNGARNAPPPPPPVAANPNNPFWDYHVLLFDPAQLQMLRSARDIANGAVPTLINLQDVLLLGDAGYPMKIDRIIELTAANAPAWTFWGSDPQPADYPVPMTGFPAQPYVMVEVRPQEPNTDLRQHAGSELSFSIKRSPRPAIAMPVELPKGAAIDLTASGIGRFGNEFSPMWIDGNYLNAMVAPFNTTGPRNYRSIFVLFGVRGEVSRVISANLNASGVPQLTDIPVTGDIHLLVGQAGETKTAPDDQLEDNDNDPLADEARDGKTPLLDSESVWVTIRSRSGEVITSPWIDPTAETTNLIPPAAGAPTNLTRQNRIRTVIGRTRTAAVDTAGS